MKSVNAETSLLERILIPLDGSTAAEAILPQVYGLLKRVDAEVILAQVLPTLSGATLPEAVLHKLRIESRGGLARHAQGLDDQGVRARSRVEEGLIAETILHMAADEKATMIAMSTHGRTGFLRFALGSIAEKILRASPIPLLLMRSRLDVTPSTGTNWKASRILVPVDGSLGSLKAIPAAIELARAFEASVTVLRVDDRDLDSSDGAFLGQLVGGGDASWIENGSKPDDDARVAAEMISAAGIQTVYFKVAGEPASQIVDFTRELPADMVVMSTHGRSGVSRWVLGSVAEKVVRASTIPILVVPQR